MRGIPLWFAPPPDTKLCPVCGIILRFHDVPGSFVPARFVAVELLLWGAIALGLTFLWAPRATSWIFLSLSIIGAAIWLRLRVRQRAEGEALLERRKYFCAQCRRRFEGSSLREIPSD